MQIVGMKNTAFNIEFVTSGIRIKNLRTTEEYKYQAVITTLSKSFNFHTYNLHAYYYINSVCYNFRGYQKVK